MQINLNFSEMSILNPSALESKEFPRHRWYYFKEGFSPLFVDQILQSEHCKANSLVMDPFSGSGTTGLVALQRGLNFFGIETNPFLHFVSKTKMQGFNHRELKLLLHNTRKGISKGGTSPLRKFSTFSEMAPAAKTRGRWLFNASVLDAFQGGLDAINAIQSPEKELAKLCLVASAMDVSNAVKDGKCLRYKANWGTLDYNRNALLNAFEDKASLIIEDIEIVDKFKSKHQIVKGDSRTESIPHKFDICITSPPYLNSFDYTDVYRPELFLGKFVTNLKELYSLRHKTVRSHIQASWSIPTRDDFGLLYEKTMRSILKNKELLWDDKLPIMIQAYFEDMENILRRLLASASPSASAWIIVSNSAYAGIEIPVDLILAEIATKSGWFLREIKVLRYLKRISGQQWNKLPHDRDANRPMLRESAIVLEKRKH